MGLATVFFWFGFNEIFSPFRWAGWVPQSILDVFSLPFDSPVLTYGIMTHGAVGIFAAVLLLSRYMKLGALILSLILASIIVFSGINEITVRDFGLLTAAVTLFLANTHRGSPDT